MGNAEGDNTSAPVSILSSNGARVSSIGSNCTADDSEGTVAAEAITIDMSTPLSSDRDQGAVAAISVDTEENAAFLSTPPERSPAAASSPKDNTTLQLIYNDIKCERNVPEMSRCSSSDSVGGVAVMTVPPQQEPPDGGLQAWAVMFASFFCNGIIFGTINSSGIIFDVLKRDLEAQGVENPASKASLCLSLTIGMTFFMSIVSGVLTDKMGVRTTTFIGGAMATLGMFLSSIVYQQIEYLTITFGILLGVGGSLAYTPSLVILGHYFRRRMGIVNGFVTAGSSLFTVFMPMLFQVLLDNYGLKVLFQVLSAMMSLLMVCAFIFKPRLAVLPPESDSKSKEDDKTPLTVKCKQLLSHVINFDIWRNKLYVIWALCIPSALFGYFVPYVHLVAFTKSVLGEDVNSKILVQCIGATSGIGRLAFGLISDQPWVDRIVLQQISFFCIGLFTMLLTAWSNFWFFVCLALGMGFFDGCFISLLGPIAFDIVGPTGAPQAIGNMLALCSLPLTFGPVFAGLLEDTLGSYFVPFLVAGIPPIFGSIAMFSMRCVKAPPQGAPGSPVKEPSEQQNNAAHHRQLQTLATENGNSSSIREEEHPLQHAMPGSSGTSSK